MKPSQQMLAISHSQLDALTAESAARFISRVQSFVLKQTGQHTSEPLLRDLLARARSYGLETEQDCVIYISVTLLFSGGSGVEAGWISEVMSTTHSPDHRISALRSQAKTRNEV